LEYYILRYHYLLFCPKDDQAGEEEFRDKESKKIELFRGKHAGFIRYLSSGATDRDAEYFLQGGGRGADHLW
jgi:hypothetical protein